MEKNKINYSDRDTDASYLSAVESGDMKTAQQMVDETAKKVPSSYTKTINPTDYASNSDV